jgi:hypothetical protein
LSDVELVVREQHEILKVFGRGAGVMAQPVQRVVHARRGEQRQRLWLPVTRLVGAVGDAVVHRRQIGQIEQIAHQQAPLGADRTLQVVGVGQREVHRNGLARRPHFECYAMVAQQQSELLAIVVAEQIWPRQRGLVDTGPCDEAIGEPRVGARNRLCVHPHTGVALAHARVKLAPRDEALQRLAQASHCVVVQHGGVIQRGLGVGEGLRGGGRLSARRGARSGGSAHGREVCVGLFTHRTSLCGTRAEPSSVWRQ